MTTMIRLPFGLAAISLLLSGCGGAPQSGTDLPLDPVPFSMAVPDEIRARLSTGPIEGPFGEQVAADGATAATTVYYQPANGERVIFMTAYWFPQDRFDALQSPDEPPLLGFEVLREAGHVLSVAGPKDSIFAPDTPDGRNLIALYGLINLPETYRADD